MDRICIAVNSGGRRGSNELKVNSWQWQLKQRHGALSVSATEESLERNRQLLSDSAKRCAACNFLGGMYGEFTGGQ